jgi:hypothetical protein
MGLKFDSVHATVSNQVNILMSSPKAPIMGLRDLADYECLTFVQSVKKWHAEPCDFVRRD